MTTMPPQANAELYGEIYMIRHTANGRYKIGFSQNSIARIAEHRRQQKARLITCFVRRGTFSGEQYLHRLYKSWSYHGEWYHFPEFLTDDFPTDILVLKEDPTLALYQDTIMEESDFEDIEWAARPPKPPDPSDREESESMDRSRAYTDAMIDAARDGTLEISGGYVTGHGTVMQRGTKGGRWEGIDAWGKYHAGGPCDHFEALPRRRPIP